MSQKKSAKIQHHFANLSDPRRRKVTYPLINIVVIAVCAVLFGADDFVAIADFGRTKRKWFARFLSEYLSARRFASAVRGHWGIENRLHWQFDVSM